MLSDVSKTDTGEYIARHSCSPRGRVLAPLVAGRWKPALQAGSQSAGAMAGSKATLRKPRQWICERSLPRIPSWAGPSSMTSHW
jgi:hypothetical protein